MNNALIIRLYFFKKINGFVEKPKTNEAGYEKDECQHCFKFCEQENANGVPVFT